MGKGKLRSLPNPLPRPGLPENRTRPDTQGPESQPFLRPSPLPVLTKECLSSPGTPVLRTPRQGAYPLHWALLESLSSAQSPPSTCRSPRCPVPGGADGASSAGSNACFLMREARARLPQSRLSHARGTQEPRGNESNIQKAPWASAKPRESASKEAAGHQLRDCP